MSRASNGSEHSPPSNCDGDDYNTRDYTPQLIVERLPPDLQLFLEKVSTVSEVSPEKIFLVMLWRSFPEPIQLAVSGHTYLQQLDQRIKLTYPAIGERWTNYFTFVGVQTQMSLQHQILRRKLATVRAKRND